MQGITENALSVLAVTEKGNLLHAPDMYMEKIAIGSNLPKNLIDLSYSVEKNINLLADAKNTVPENLTACILERPRHKLIIEKLKQMGVNIVFISDGDVSGVLSVAESSSNIDIYIGTGGAPEGVLAAAALHCLDCQMQTKLVFRNDNERARAKKLGIKNPDRKYNIEDMVKGDVIFCATGVTDGDFVKGIEIIDNHFKSETFLLHKESKTKKVVKNLTKL